jgi:hypothetical protein
MTDDGTCASWFCSTTDDECGRLIGCCGECGVECDSDIGQPCPVGGMCTPGGFDQPECASGATCVPNAPPNDYAGVCVLRSSDGG